jgi:hypothetical protein
LSTTPPTVFGFQRSDLADIGQTLKTGAGLIDKSEPRTAEKPAGVLREAPENFFRAKVLDFQTKQQI